MAGSADWPVQEALYARLNGDATLQTLLGGAGRIIDDAQAGADLPYLTLGESIEAPMDTFSREGRNVLTAVHVWSDYAGHKQAKQLADRVVALLHRYDLAVAGWSRVYCLYEQTNTLRDPDGVTRHAVVRFRVFVQV